MPTNNGRRPFEHVVLWTLLGSMLALILCVALSLNASWATVAWFGGAGAAGGLAIGWATRGR